MYGPYDYVIQSSEVGGVAMGTPKKTQKIPKNKCEWGKKMKKFAMSMWKDK
jgi:hypothetical protein